MMFMGEYSHTLDAKSRIIIPAKFREELGEQFVLTLGLDGCLYAYPNAEWESVVEQLNQLPSSKEARKIQRYFLSSASPCELDKQGRVLIPARHKQHAKLEKDVIFVGVSKKIEIWSKECYDDLTFDGMDDAAEKLSELGISF